MTADTGSAPPCMHPFRSSGRGTCSSTQARPEGPKVRLDSDARTGPGPFDMLLAAVAACAATDVVEIMKKQRTPLEALRVRVEAYRVVSTPRRLASVILHFTLQGPGITEQKAARAVELSVTKYCSVRSSL